MPLPIWICGAECGLIEAGPDSTPAGAGRHISSNGGGAGYDGTVTNVTTQTAGLHSKRAFKFAAVGNSTNTLFEFSQFIASPATAVVRFYIYFEVLPDSITGIFSLSNGLLGLRYNPTGTKLEVCAGVTGNLIRAGSFVPSTGRWYRIDLKMTRGATYVIDWQVDGVAQTQASIGGSANSMADLRFGHNSQGVIAGSTTGTFTYYIDDIIVSGTATDYPFGAGGVQGLYPNGDGVHNYSAADDFKYDYVTNVNATSSLETGTWTTLQNPLSRTINHFMAQFNLGTTEYLAWTFDPLTADYSLINGIDLISTVHVA